MSHIIKYSFSEVMFFLDMDPFPRWITISNGKPQITKNRK